MKIYQLTRSDKIGYDEAVSFVIAAENEPDTRYLAASHCGDEGEEIWLIHATCLEIGTSYYTTAEVLCRNFRHG